MQPSETLDSVLAVVSDWNCDVRSDKAKYETVSDVAEPLEWSDMPKRSCENLNNVYTLFDYQDNLTIAGESADIVRHYVEHGATSLLEAIRPPELLPAK